MSKKYKYIFPPLGLLLIFSLLNLEDNYTVKLTNGDTLSIKESDTKCSKESSRWHAITISGSRSVPSSPDIIEKFYTCRANGVRTDLAGYQRAYSQTTKNCKRQPSSIPCKAGEYFNMINKNYNYDGRAENECFLANGSRKESTMQTKKCNLRVN